MALHSTSCARVILSRRTFSGSRGGKVRRSRWSSVSTSSSTTSSKREAVDVDWSIATEVPPPVGVDVVNAGAVHAVARRMRSRMCGFDVHSASTASTNAWDFLHNLRTMHVLTFMHLTVWYRSRMRARTSHASAPSSSKEAQCRKNSIGVFN